MEEDKNREEGKVEEVEMIKKEIKVQSEEKIEKVEMDKMKGERVQRRQKDEKGVKEGEKDWGCN